MKAIAVGRFEQQHIGDVDRRRIGEHGARIAPQVAAEENRLAVRADAGVRGAEQVPGVDEVQFDAGCCRHQPLVADRLEQSERSLRVFDGVERQCRLVLRVAAPVRVPRILFLNVR